MMGMRAIADATIFKRDGEGNFPGIASPIVDGRVAVVTATIAAAGRSSVEVRKLERAGFA